MNYIALQDAISAGNYEQVKNLLNNDIDPSFAPYGQTPLYLAISHNHLNIFNLLINYPMTNLLTVDRYSNTIIHHIVMLGRVEMLVIILTLIPSYINKLNYRHRSALYYALFNRHYQIVDVLLEHNANITNKEIKCAIKYVNNNNIMLHKILLIKGEFDDRYIYKLLRYTMPYKNNAAFDMLCQLYPDHVRSVINFKDHKHHEFTLLHRSIFKQNIDIITKLLKLGADPNIDNYNGNTSLHTSASMGYFEIVKLLLEYGADHNVKNNNDETPLDVAKAEGHYQIIEYLSSYQSLPEIKEPANDEE